MVGMTADFSDQTITATVLWDETWYLANFRCPCSDSATRINADSFYVNKIFMVGTFLYCKRIYQGIRLIKEKTLLDKITLFRQQYIQNDKNIHFTILHALSTTTHVMHTNL